MWPINRVSDTAMFYGVAMNVIDVPRKINLIPNLIPNLIFPIPPPPDAALTLGLAAGTNMLAFCQPPGKPGLDECPAQWVVGIARWQAPYRMQVFRYASKMEERYKGMAGQEV